MKLNIFLHIFARWNKVLSDRVYIKNLTINIKKMQTKLLRDPFPFFTILLLLFASISLQAQTWTKLTSGTSNNLYDVSAPSTTISYVVGASGTILNSTDAGNTWMAQNSGTSQNLYSVDFTSTTSGFAVGNNGAALKTTDGGTTWTTMVVDPTNIVNFRDIRFFNSQIGFASGGNPSGGFGVIYRTQDQGVTWTQVFVDSMDNYACYSSFFTSATTGYASNGSGRIFETTDGGTTWNVINTGNGLTSGKIYFTSQTKGVYSSNNGQMYITTNAGSTWNSAPSVTTNFLQGIAFYDTLNGYVVGGDVSADTATLLQTTNGGAAWSKITLSSTTSRLAGIDFFDSNTGFIVGMDGTILKFNSCTSLKWWTKLTSGTSNNLYDVSAPSTTISYVVGASGTILNSTDAGNTWMAQNSGTSQNLYSVDFTSTTSGFAVGNNGAALKTTDGGTTWTTMVVDPTNIVNFRDIRFFNSQIGFASGGNPSGGFGVIYRTQDQGVTWTQVFVDSMDNYACYSSFFTSATTGYASNGSGRIFETTDGGTTWNVINTGNGLTSGKIYFTSQTKGVYSSNNGQMYITTNAGSTWNSAPSVTTNFLQGIAFYDTLNGYVVGGDVSADTATLLQTTNGGAAWSKITLSSATSRLAGIDFFDSNTGFIVGMDGTILKFNSCTSSANTTTTVSPIPNSSLTLTASPSATTSSLLCNGAAQIKVKGGQPPYSIIFKEHSKIDSILNIDSLCTGVYSVKAFDSLNDSTSVSFEILSPPTTKYHPSHLTYPDSLAKDTLMTSPIVNCVINYSAIDSILISNYSFIGIDSINVFWKIYQANAFYTQQARYKYSKQGVYTLALNLYCTNRSAGTSVEAFDQLNIDRSTGISIITTNSFSVYPNPFNNNLTVGLNERSSVKLTDISGRELYSFVFEKGTSTIETSTLTSGIYFITIANNSGMICNKLIKN